MTDDEEFRDLADRTQILRDWAEQHGWTLYTDRLTAEVAKHNRRVLGGDLTPEQYQRACGVIQGLQIAAGLPAQVGEEFDRRALQRAQEAMEAEEVPA